MNRDLQKKIVEKCPNLYKRVGESPRRSCMAFGLEVGDGWYDLIMELSTKLEALDQDIIAAQVKEKFGTLRFYTESSTTEACKLITEAENKSREICECCGKLGKLRNDRSWVKTLCEDCKDG